MTGSRQTPFGLPEKRAARRSQWPRDRLSSARRALIALFGPRLPAYWARTGRLDLAPPGAVAGDENLTRQIGAFVVGDVLLRPRRTAA